MDIFEVGSPNVATLERSFGGTLRPTTLRWAIPSIEQFYTVLSEVYNAFSVVLEDSITSA